jgi:hypothetical protein
MATNPWISQSVRSEQDLYEDLVIESLKFYGQDVYYLPREIVNKDKVFLDDVPSRFSDAYKIEMYIENTDGFGGEGDLFSKFGVELRDQATFIVARRRWKGLIGDKLDSYNFRPREGDLIYLPLSQSIFEIFKVETETPFYQLSQLPTFRLQCELFEYNDEDFDTDIDDIDGIEEEAAYQYKLIMDSPEVATATALAEIDVNGSIVRFDVSSLGKGYLTAPTVTIESVVGSNSKFGNASLNVTKGRGSEGDYSQTGPHGTIEAWVYIDNLPASGQSIIFKTGGSDNEPEKTYFWGVDALGRLVYSRGDNLGGTVTTLTGSSILFLEDTWHHILIGGFDTNNIVIYFDSTKQLDTALAGVTFDFVTSEGYSVGATAARTVDGINWTAMDGFIDEFRVQVGSRSQILEPRYATPGNSATIETQSAQWSEDITYDAKLLHFNAISATAISTITSDGRIESIELTHAGLYYDEIPIVTLSAPYSGGNYKRNTIVSQDQTSFIMKGEVAKWSDSDNTLYLTHVGATDGAYHTFNTINAVVSDHATYAPSLVEELNRIQSVDTVGNDVVTQNDYFDDFEANFLDFSENNPFGDVS